MEPEENGVHAGPDDDRDILTVLEQADEYLSGTDDDDAGTEATGTENDGEGDYADADAENEEQKSPIEDISPMDWGDMNDELDEFLDGDDDDESDHSDASNDSRTSTLSVRSRKDQSVPAASASKKRKHTDTSSEASENEVSSDERAVLNGQGSSLQRRKKRALERVSSLTNVATAEQDNDSGLPSPDTTAPEDGGKTGSLAADAAADNTEGDDDEDDDFAAELEREFEDAGDFDEGNVGES